MIETAPVHEMKVEVIEHVRRVQDLLWRVDYCPRVGRPKHESKVEIIHKQHLCYLGAEGFPDE